MSRTESTLPLKTMLASFRATEPSLPSWEWLRRAIVLGSIALFPAASAPASGGDAASLPVDRARPTESLWSQGDNGRNLDPWVISITSTATTCKTGFVFRLNVANLCGDDDGCTLRLVADSIGGNLPIPVQSIATNANATWWWIAVTLTEYQGRENGDGIEQEIVARILPGGGDVCTFFDDAFELLGTHFGLEACPYHGEAVTCTLRIDD